MWPRKPPSSSRCPLAETALQRQYRARLQGIRAAALRRVVAADVASTGSFVDSVVPIVLAAQSVTVAEADAYLSAEAGMATGSSTRPWGLDPTQLIGVRARRGDWLEDVYGRNHRADASSFAERMAREVTTDITLADRSATFVHTEGDSRITGYRRIASGTACGLCVVAATRRYHKSDLRPLHHACGCTTAPIYRADAGWQKPGKAKLNSLYEQAGGTDARSLSRIRPADPSLPEVLVVDSTLGPTLVAA